MPIGGVFNSHRWWRSLLCRWSDSRLADRCRVGGGCSCGARSSIFLQRCTFMHVAVNPLSAKLHLSIKLNSKLIFTLSRISRRLQAAQQQIFRQEGHFHLKLILVLNDTSHSHHPEISLRGFLIYLCRWLPVELSEAVLTILFPAFLLFLLVQITCTVCQIRAISSTLTLVTTRPSLSFFFPRRTLKLIVTRLHRFPRLQFANLN